MINIYEYSCVCMLRLPRIKAIYLFGYYFSAGKYIFRRGPIRWGIFLWIRIFEAAVWITTISLLAQVLMSWQTYSNRRYLVMASWWIFSLSLKKHSLFSATLPLKGDWSWSLVAIPDSNSEETAYLILHFDTVLSYLFLAFFNDD